MKLEIFNVFWYNIWRIITLQCAFRVMAVTGYGLGLLGKCLLLGGSLDDRLLVVHTIMSTCAGILLILAWVGMTIFLFIQGIRRTFKYPHQMVLWFVGVFFLAFNPNLLPIPLFWEDTWNNNIFQPQTLIKIALLFCLTLVLFKFLP